jgi:hypothetical protein
MGLRQRPPVAFEEETNMLAKIGFPRAVTLSILFGALAGGCDAADGAALDPPEVAWKDMNGNQRMVYMTTVVAPRMREVYQRFDPVKFERFDCTTCHGKQPEARAYKMPATEVPTLPGSAAAFEAKLAVEADWPRWTKFMVEEVEPPMADMLGQPLWDPAKPEAPAFSCQACHGLEK